MLKHLSQSLPPLVHVFPWHDMLQELPHPPLHPFLQPFIHCPKQPLHPITGTLALTSDALCDNTKQPKIGKADFAAFLKNSA